MLLTPQRSIGGAGDDAGRCSPCPSPTPLFQQLYAAVAHWERVLSGSPELLLEVLGKYSPDVTKEELKKRTASMHNLSVESSGSGAEKMQRDVSIRRRSSPGSLLLAAAAAERKKSEMNPE